jgi:DNA-binding LacI/PurR family transcriptional regulator
MGKKVTLQMIAQRAGVSVVTVSNVLSGKKGASDQVRNLIFSLAEETGYQKSALKDREKERTYRFGVLIAERYVKEYPSFYMHIYKEIAKEAAKRNSLTILEVIDEERERLENQAYKFADAEIDGLLIIGEMSPLFVDMVRKSAQVPVVGVDFYNVDMDMDFIITDSFRGMEKATERLIQFGHRDITFVGTPKATNSIMDRYMGYCKALLQNHIDNTSLICDRNMGEEGSVIEFDLPFKLPTAFVCNCERTTGVLIEKLRERGLRIPKDVSIVAFDRFLDEYPEEMEVTTYEIDENALARISVTTLLKRISGKGKPAGITVVNGILKEGNTVKRREE